MALLLAANPRNLLQHSQGKTALQYFKDFTLLAQRASPLSTKNGSPIPREQKGAALSVLQLIHALCHALFTGRAGSSRR